ncbi:hypothetical protein BKN38_02620 [Helicobacter sp. CLO-3]|uniref:hypothetical protein n=1 Tax=unclassified Helicobacter TaxID=2593540 RepID=UPI00080540C6|nr:MULTISPECIES: hypothetical protein [unclassified Helicobacter]OBV29410.1 hypothetical protein BA723_00415 [Helicobacter sp. CLO-3]OHU84694.1 hypothetical protein BKN38_02620 [Helicobacter sp. CLO-3]
MGSLVWLILGFCVLVLAIALHHCIVASWHHLSIAFIAPAAVAPAAPATPKGSQNKGRSIAQNI